MQTTKSHKIGITFIIFLVIVAIGLFVHKNSARHVSLADYGVVSVKSYDCSPLQNASSSAPVTVSIDAPDVTIFREKVKALVTKYNGQITTDSLNSYPQYAPGGDMSNTESVSITASNIGEQDAFLKELSIVVKELGARNTGFNYAETPVDANYSVYSQCLVTVQTVRADILQLELFTNEISKRPDNEKISLLTQLISNVKNSLSNDVSMLNQYFSNTDSASVTITATTIQK